MNCLVVFMYKSSSYEGTLVRFDKTVHMWSQASGKHLGEKLGKAVNQTNWSVVIDGCSFLFLAEHYHVSLIYQVKTPIIKHGKPLKCELS